MTIGKYQLQLGADQLTSGMSSSDYATDGALGVSSTGLNPFINPGVMGQLASSTDLSTNIVDNIIASAEDSQTVSSYYRTFIGDAGNYYTYTNPSTVTKTNTATTNASFYTSGITDMVSFALNTYVSTANGDIDLWNTSGTPALTNSWWVGTKGQTAMTSNVPHPMVPYQGFLYVADKNKINTIDGSGTIALAVLTLNTNEIIYAMGIDPLTGLLMLSVQTTINLSDNISSRFFVYLYDGISSKSTRKIPVDDLITAFHNVEGSVYVGQGATLGQWNGNGVTFLRKLQFASLTSGDLIYKHRITNTRNILHVVDGPNVLSYGTVVSGKPKGFFYTAFNPSGSGHLSVVIPMGFNKIAVGYTTNKLALYDFLSTSAGLTALYFNNIYFPRLIFIRRIRILTTGVAVTSQFGVGSLNIFDEKSKQYFTVPATFVNQTGATKYVFDYDFSSVELQGLLARINMDTLNFSIVRVYVYYDIAQ